MAEAEALVRPHKRTFYVKFGPKDRERSDLSGSLIDLGCELKEIDGEIGKLKDRRSPIAKEFAKVEEKLILGKPHDVECSELFVHDANEVWIRRNDSGRVVDKRPMTDADREMQMDAFETKETVTIED